MIRALARYWHTLRHLRPVQVYGRALHRFRRPGVDLRAAPLRRSLNASAWVAPAEHAGSMAAATRFRFLGEERSLDAGGWDDAGVEKLWRYNLHYFADLTSVDAAARTSWHRDLVERWIRENPPGAGSGWEPYPTSLRIVNWVKWALAGNALSASAEQSLAIQARWLSRRVERHLLGNHLFANAKALLFAGLLFDGPEADAWLSIASEILRNEIPEQILADGGQFERTPMYHALALEDALDICNVVHVCDHPPAGVMAVAGACRARIAQMRYWLAVMSHPDGEIAFFNDAAFGIAPEKRALEEYAARLSFPEIAPPATGLTRLEPSGYARLSNESAVVLVDVAPVGPDYLPGHAHADTLSFELSVFSRRVFVNSGTSLYGVSDERLRQRGTAAHNTVVIDGLNSSEVWSGFRVGRRARPFDVRMGDGPTSLAGAHDGYRHLRGSRVHRRRWHLRGEALIVTDIIEGAFRTAESRLHLHPDVQPIGALDIETAERTLRLANGTAMTVRVEGGSMRVEVASWHPRFGESVPTHCLVIRFTGTSLRTQVDWETA